MKTINRLILWLELRDVPVWLTLAKRWRLTIPAIACLANAARRCGLRPQAWALAALAWEVWDAVGAETLPAWQATMRLLPWTGGAEPAWQVASGVPEATPAPARCRGGATMG
jgi:hypothetical protein